MSIVYILPETYTIGLCKLKLQQKQQLKSIKHALARVIKITRDLEMLFIKREIFLTLIPLMHQISQYGY